MAEEQLFASPYSISVEHLKDMVNKWLQREHGSDDVDFLNDMGGMNWLQRGLQTNIKTGVDISTLASREKAYGSNRKAKVKPKSLAQLMWEAFEDLILRILFVAGIVSIGINTWAEADHRETAWIEGFAILVAVLLVVMVSAVNNLKKEREFQRLNEQAESGKKVSIIRSGKEIDDLQMGDILVGDLVILKSGNDIPSVIMMAGTKVLTGNGSMIVINVGKNSSIGKIQEIMTSGEEELTPLQMKLEKIARDIGFFGLAAAIIIFVILIIRLLVEGGQEDWKKGS